MKTLAIVGAALLAVSRIVPAANPSRTLHPDDADQLKAAGIQISYTVVVNDIEHPDYAFTVTANAPAGITGLDAYFALQNSKGLISRTGWTDTGGKCVAEFTVGKQALQDAVFWVQHYRGERNSAFSASGGYLLHLARFANDDRYRSGRIGVLEAAPAKDFRIAAPFQANGMPLTIEVTPKEKDYNFHVVWLGHMDQQIPVRSKRPITRGDVRLADLNGDGFLDILIATDLDHRGQDTYQTLLFDKGKKVYRWITDETEPAGEPAKPSRR